MTGSFFALVHGVQTTHVCASLQMSPHLGCYRYSYHAGPRHISGIPIHTFSAFNLFRRDYAMMGKRNITRLGDMKDGFKWINLDTRWNAGDTLIIDKSISLELRDRLAKYEWHS